MNPSFTSPKIILAALALGLGIDSISAQQVAEAGGWYARIQQDNSRRIDMTSASMAGGNDVFISSDINNDGSADYVAAGVYENLVTGVSWARVYVYSGFTSEILYTWENSAVDFGCRLEVTIAGDINSDGFPDILVGAPLASSIGKPACGAAVLISGATGETLKIWYGDKPGAFFGASVAGVDDVDRNGFRDIIVGAPGTWLGAPKVGAAHVFSGSWNGDPNFGQHLYAFNGVHANSGFGSRVAAADDVNRDGYPDIVISAPGYDSPLGHQYPGTVDVYSGLDGSPLAHWQGRNGGRHFGYSIAGVGDIDRDGYPDIAVGLPAFQNDPVLQQGGVLVFSGLTHSVIRHYQGHEMGDGFGASISPTGDTNGDFWPDVFHWGPMRRKWPWLCHSALWRERCDFVPRLRRGQHIAPRALTWLIRQLKPLRFCRFVSSVVIICSRLNRCTICLHRGLRNAPRRQSFIKQPDASYPQGRYASRHGRPALQNIGHECWYHPTGYQRGHTNASCRQHASATLFEKPFAGVHQEQHGLAGPCGRRNCNNRFPSRAPIKCGWF